MDLRDRRRSASWCTPKMASKVERMAKPAIGNGEKNDGEYRKNR